MSKKVLVSLDMNKNEIQNVVMQSLATAPTSPKEGQYYYNSADKKAYQWNGSVWELFGGVEITVDSTLSSTSTNPVQNKAVSTGLVKSFDSTSTDSIYTIKGKAANGSEVTSVEIPGATKLKAGLLTAADKQNIDNINNKANKSEAIGNLAISGGTTISWTAVDGSSPEPDSITIPNATTTTAGAMSAADKTKLDGIASGANKTVVDASVTQNGNNPVTGKAIYDYVGDAIAALPKEQFLDLTKTTFVQSFAWSSTSYPGSTNPSLEGKPVLVLALKNSSDNTVAYSFLNMYELVDTYTADSPINVSGRKIIHVNSGVTAGSYGSTSAQAPNFGETVNMPYTTVDATGHVTAAGTATAKIPNNVATTEKAGLMSASDKDKLDNTLKLKKAKLVIDPSNTSATATLSVSSPEIIAVEAMYYDDSKGDGYEAVIVDWESDGPTFKASIAQAETQLSIWIHVLYI